jgi:hypothetical protein
MQAYQYDEDFFIAPNMIGKDAVEDEVHRVAQIAMDDVIKPSEGNSKETIEQKRMNKNPSPMKELSHATSFKTSENYRDSISASNLNYDNSKKRLNYDVSLGGDGKTIGDENDLRRPGSSIKSPTQPPRDRDGPSRI